jgi:hypothetical protein
MDDIEFIKVAKVVVEQKEVTVQKETRMDSCRTCSSNANAVLKLKLWLLRVMLLRF